MPCQIIISNLSAVPKAELINLVSDVHVFTKNETMQLWLSSGGLIADWNRVFSLVIISDKTEDQMLWIKEKLIESIGGVLIATKNRYYFSEPDQDSPFFKSLYSTGQVTVTYDELIPFIIDRSI